MSFFPGTAEGRKRAIFIIWPIVVAAAIVLSIRHNSPRPPAYCSPAGAANRLGAFTYCCPGHDGGRHPLFSMHFDSLHAENGSLGIFKTGSYKIVKIQGLRLELARYLSESQLSLPQGLERLSEILSPRASINSRNSPLDIVRQLISRSNGWTLDVDLSNTSEIRVNNFDYRIFDNNKPNLAVHSRLAVFSSDWPEILLRGHVTITAADGSTLQCNRIRWNAEKQIFSTDDRYLLNRCGEEITGKGIRVDARLKKTEEKNTEDKFEEKTKCFAKQQ